MEIFESRNTICRTCMSENREVAPIISLQKFGYLKTTICDALTECVSVQVSEGDGLPQHVCTKCIDELQRAYLFRKLCEKTDAILRIQFMKFEDPEDLSDVEVHVKIETEMMDEEVREVFPQEDSNDRPTESKNVEVGFRAAKEETGETQLDFKEMCNSKEYTVLPKLQLKTMYKNGPADNASTIQNSLPSHNGLSWKEDRLDFFECKICSLVLVSKAKLKNHVMTHTGEKPYACDLCPMTFTTRGNLKRHKTVHRGERSHKCPDCGARFFSTYDLTRHRRKHGNTGGASKRFVCDVCGSGFTTASNLTTHKVLHTDKRPFKCTICERLFTSNYNLKVHVRGHTGEKPYKCDVCGWSTTIVSVLAKHKERHFGDYPYRCTVCSLGFEAWKSLKLHKRIHTAKKVLGCSRCSASFATRWQLSQHKLFDCENEGLIKTNTLARDVSN